jgi:hypothetical protein
MIFTRTRRAYLHEAIEVRPEEVRLQPPVLAAGCSSSRPRHRIVLKLLC